MSLRDDTSRVGGDMEEHSPVGNGASDGFLQGVDVGNEQISTTHQRPGVEHSIGPQQMLQQTIPMEEETSQLPPTGEADHISSDWPVLDILDERDGPEGKSFLTLWAPTWEPKCNLKGTGLIERWNVKKRVRARLLRKQQNDRLDARENDTSEAQHRQKRQRIEL